MELTSLEVIITRHSQTLSDRIQKKQVVLKQEVIATVEVIPGVTINLTLPDHVAEQIRQLCLDAAEQVIKDTRSETR